MSTQQVFFLDSCLADDDQHGNSRTKELNKRDDGVYHRVCVRVEIAAKKGRPLVPSMQVITGVSPGTPRGAPNADHCTFTMTVVMLHPAS